MNKQIKRTNMRPEDRRTQILDCAQGLFFSKGYDATTINDIIGAAGVSKGGFYHHFNSKDELMGGILERLIVQAIAAYQPVIETKNLTAMQRYELYFEILCGQQTAETLNEVLPVIVALFRDENAIMQLRLSNLLTEAFLPVFSEILRLGMEEGIFQIDDPDTTAKLIIQIGNHHQFSLKPAVDAKTEVELDAAGEMLVASLKLQGIATDRLLGIPDGTTVYRAADFAPALIEMLREIKLPGSDGSGKPGSADGEKQ